MLNVLHFDKEAINHIFHTFQELIKFQMFTVQLYAQGGIGQACRASFHSVVFYVLLLPKSSQIHPQNFPISYSWNRQYSQLRFFELFYISLSIKLSFFKIQRPGEFKKKKSCQKYAFMRNYETFSLLICFSSVCLLSCSVWHYK